MHGIKKTSSQETPRFLRPSFETLEVQNLRRPLWILTAHKNRFRSCAAVISHPASRSLSLSLSLSERYTNLTRVHTHPVATDNVPRPRADGSRHEGWPLVSHAVHSKIARPTSLPHKRGKLEEEQESLISSRRCITMIHSLLRSMDRRRTEGLPIKTFLFRSSAEIERNRKYLEVITACYSVLQANIRRAVDVVVSVVHCRSLFFNVRLEIQVGEPLSKSTLYLKSNHSSANVSTQ